MKIIYLKLQKKKLKTKNIMKNNKNEKLEEEKKYPKNSKKFQKI